ncbi:MAG: A/G-specific adenine glycosylase [Candidatus Delongbacteria bacterium]|nr:A/G-specific adenine glycosylase [Candidatus Delongbacteria bacterium]
MKDFHSILLEWFDRHQRDLPWRKSGDIYAIWVSEVMLQQTQVKTVVGYYHRFMTRFPDVAALAAADPGEVLKLWEGLGYYTRARHLHQAARMVMEHYQGRIPCHPEGFSRLPGAGVYITAAVMSIACGFVIPVVDGNVLRVYARYAGYDRDIRSQAAHRHIREALTHLISPQRPGDFNQAMMELGALICRVKSPLCPDCPLQLDCFAYRSGSTDRFPYRSPSKIIPEYRVSVAVIIRDRQIYIQQRKAEGHLGGMWEFPGGKAESDETEIRTLQRECLEELGIEPRIRYALPIVRHAYSHFRIILTPLICYLNPGDEPRPAVPFRWIPAHQLDQLPFPAANHKIFADLRRLEPDLFTDG